MLFKQFVDDDLGCASYLVGDEDEGVALVVDPAYAVEQYLDEAERRGVRLVRVLETHTHADHVSGHGRLALEHGLPVSIHPAAEPEYPFEPLRDGEQLRVGGVSLRTIHTPGHRPDHCAFAVTDHARADEPWLVLTGDSLFVGDAARPDLAVEARAGAEALHGSLARLLELPDGVEVYPGHVAGSLCGAGMSAKASTTIGFERRFNRMLSGEVAEFVARSTGVQTPRPPNMDRIVALNRGPFVGAPPPLEPLFELDGGAVLDVRAAHEFAAGHVRGAVNVPLDGGGFATKAAFVLSPDDRIAVDAASARDAERAANALRAVGFLELAGYLVDARRDERFDPVDLDRLDDLLAAGAVELVDVREYEERSGGYIAGSRHIPYRLIRLYGGELPAERPVVTICETGARAAVAASVLAAAGVDARPVLDGGVSTWQARGRPTVEFRRCGS